MAAWSAVRPRVKALQDDGFAIFEDRTRWHLAFHLSGYISYGDSVLLFSKETPADNLPVIVPLSVLEKLIALAGRHAIAQLAQKEKA